MDSITIPAAKFRPTAIWTLSATFMCRQRCSQHQPSIFQPPNSCKKTSSFSRVQISAHFSILQHPPGLPLTFQPLPEVAADPDTSAFRNLSNLSRSKCCISTMRSLLHIYRTSQSGISIQFQKKINSKESVFGRVSHKPSQWIPPQNSPKISKKLQNMGQSHGPQTYLHRSQSAAADFPSPQCFE